MDKTKKGMALFITLLIIASILSIVAVSFSYLEKAQDDASEASSLIQGNLLYKNTINILKRIFPKGKVDSKKLDILYTIPLMLSEEKSGFMVNLQCTPLMMGIPIGWLDEEKNKKSPEKYALARKVLIHILEKFELKESSELEQLIFSELSGIKEYGSDFESRLGYARGIFSRRQFDKVLLEYRMKYDDVSVFKVPWEKYFVFIRLRDTAKIDGEYLSAEVISAAFDISLDIVKDGWVTDSKQEKKQSLQSFLSENGASEGANKKLFSKKGLNAMHCEETYAYRDNHYRFSFDYSDERSANFEFYGKL
jgi:hypothetical protein